MDTEGRFFYTNGLELAVSAYDFNLKFLRQGAPENPEPGKQLAPARLDELIVGMSPGHAKTMLVGLYKAVRDYEANIGHITVNAEDQKKFDDAFPPTSKEVNPLCTPIIQGSKLLYRSF